MNWEEKLNIIQTQLLPDGVLLPQLSMYEPRLWSINIKNLWIEPRHTSSRPVHEDYGKSPEDVVEQLWLTLTNGMVNKVIYGPFSDRRREYKWTGTEFKDITDLKEAVIDNAKES